MPVSFCLEILSATSFSFFFFFTSLALSLPFLLSDPDSRVDDLDILEASHPELFETPLRTGRELVEAFQSIAQQISDSFVQEFDESQTKDGMMLVIVFPTSPLSIEYLLFPFMQLIIFFLVLSSGSVAV